MHAANKGDLTMLTMIAKKHPTYLGMKDDLGWQPIHEAARSGSVGCVKLILEHGIDINVKTRTGVNPLNIALEYLGEDHSVTKFLIENGAINIDEEEPEL